MKKLLFILLLIPCVSFAQDTFYVATTGNNGNAGTIGSPFLTWEKLTDVMGPGDVGYIRGGSYPSPNGGADDIHCLWTIVGTSGSPCIIQNYPGEYPIFDLTAMGTPTHENPVAVKALDCQYLTIKGLTITGLKQHQGGDGISYGFVSEGSEFITHEQIVVNYIGGFGFALNGSDDNTYINCDAHHLDDRYSVSSGAWQGSNGFTATGGETSTRTVYNGCRAWWCSDDGWDFFNTDGIRTLINCWSFWNGFQPGTKLTGGDGQGFKLGPTNTVPLASITRILKNCLAFENRQTGFDQNTTQTQFTMYNNTSVNNGTIGFNFSWYPSHAQDFKNNIAYGNMQAQLDETGGNVGGSNNTWDGGVTVGYEDFIQCCSMGMDMPRSADGCLPALRFFQLKPSSDLINAGIDVGLPFIDRSSDIGYKETNNLTELSFKRVR